MDKTSVLLCNQENKYLANYIIIVTKKWNIQTQMETECTVPTLQDVKLRLKE